MKSMYGMTNSGKLFADELTEQLLDAGFIQSQFQMSIYYKYAPDGSKIVVLSYVDDCVYWYTYEALGKWFVDTFGNIFYVGFLVYAHWFISIIISQMKDHSIYVNQARYATSIVAKYLDTSTVKAIGPACCKRGNLVPWSAPVAQVHPRTAQHCYLPYQGTATPETMAR